MGRSEAFHQIDEALHGLVVLAASVVAALAVLLLHGAADEAIWSFARVVLADRRECANRGEHCPHVVELEYVFERGRRVAKRREINRVVDFPFRSIGIAKQYFSNLVMSLNTPLYTE